MKPTLKELAGGVSHYYHTAILIQEKLALKMKVSTEDRAKEAKAKHLVLEMFWKAASDFPEEVAKHVFAAQDYLYEEKAEAALNTMYRALITSALIEEREDLSQVRAIFDNYQREKNNEERKQ